MTPDNSLLSSLQNFPHDSINGCRFFSFRNQNITPLLDSFPFPLVSMSKDFVFPFNQTFLSRCAPSQKVSPLTTTELFPAQRTLSSRMQILSDVFKNVVQILKSHFSPNQQSTGHFFQEAIRRQLRLAVHSMSPRLAPSTRCCGRYSTFPRMQLFLQFGCLDAF